ncbi:GDSL-type esterase/lipase family protein, partial [Streptomyces fuscichromogenes]|uniref:GDSL-type esterase/lipase family protein n=1 Tax=Streptomyces fuscichromogenes TaxID=1324013 RepID=UPI001E2E947A
MPVHMSCVPYAFEDVPVIRLFATAVRRPRHGTADVRAAIAAVLVLVSLTTLVGTAAGAQAQSGLPRLSLGRSLPAGMTLATTDSDIVMSFDIDVTYDRATLQQEVDAVTQSGETLGEQVRDQIASAPTGLPEGGLADFNDFDGTVALTATGLTVTIPVDQVHTAANWKQQWVAAAVGVGVGFGTRAICIGSAVLASGGGAAAIGVLIKTGCAALGLFAATMGRAIVLMAFDNKLGDSKEWGAAILNASMAAVGGVLWEGGGNIWALNRLPGMLVWIGQQFVRLGNWIGSQAAAVGEWFGDVITWVRQRLAANPPPAPPPSPATLMALGDSITYGLGSSTGAAYRAEMHDALTTVGFTYDAVGSEQSGSNLADPDNEGHSGWRIDQIAAAVDGWLTAYHPNVVTLHIGTNDMNQNYAVATAPDRLGALIDQIVRDRPGVLLVVSTLVPSKDAAVNARISAYNASIPAVVASRHSAGDHVYLVDQGAVTTAELSDTLHPDDEGYRRMGRAFAAGVNAAYLQDGLTVIAGSPEDGGGADPHAPGCESGAGGWSALGQIASGVGQPGASVRFADYNGDGRADYWVLNDNGSV